MKWSGSPSETEGKQRQDKTLHGEYPQIWLHYDAYGQDVYNRRRVK